MRHLLVAGLIALSLVAAACGSGGRSAEHDEHSGSGDRDAAEGTVPGSAADASEADRKIEVVASDELRFEPGSIEISAGEVITFVVRNEGKTDHEFVVGDEAYQAMHEEEMGEGHMMESDSAVSVAPGETQELTWRFSDAGEVLYGCHEPGHYDGGMVGTIAVG